MAGIGLTDNSGDLNGVGVNTSHQMKIVPETDTINNLPNVGGVRAFGENDTGFLTGVPQLYSPETDLDYRQRSASDALMDEECFNYAAQNTGKHTYANTTMTAAWTVGSFNTNSGAILTASTGLTFGSYAFFPILGTHTLAADIEAAFSAAMPANSIIDFGFFLRGATTQFAPADGVYLRMTSAGLQGVINNNGTETLTPIFAISATNSAPWLPVPTEKYQFIIYVTPRS